MFASEYFSYSLDTAERGKTKKRVYFTEFFLKEYVIMRYSLVQLSPVFWLTTNLKNHIKTTLLYMLLTTIFQCKAVNWNLLKAIWNAFVIWDNFTVLRTFLYFIIPWLIRLIIAEKYNCKSSYHDVSFETPLLWHVNNDYFVI